MLTERRLVLARPKMERRKSMRDRRGGGDHKGSGKTNKGRGDKGEAGKSR